LRRREFLSGREPAGGGVKDVLWLRPDGQEMTPDDWNQAHARCLAMFLSGASIGTVDAQGREIADDDFLLMFNADAADLAFTLPSLPGEPWRLRIDTFEPGGLPAPRALEAGAELPVRARSLVLLQRALAPEQGDA
jgi:glycogen operon protein